MNLRYDLKSEESAEKIANNIINVTLSLLKIKKHFYVSGLTVRYDKYERKGKEVNVILKKNVMIKILVSLIIEI